MNTTVTMTLDEIKNLPPLTQKRKKQMDAFAGEDFSDIPKMTKKELKEFKPWRQLHPDWVKIKKGDVHTKIDMDLLAALKQGGRGYQKRLNQTLRWAYENDCPFIKSHK